MNKLSYECVKCTDCDIEISVFKSRNKTLVDQCQDCFNKTLINKCDNDNKLSSDGMGTIFGEF